MPYIHPNLHEFGRRDTSQNDEDGVIERIAADLGIQAGTFFEFGIGPAHGGGAELEGNFVALRRRGWTGVFLDGGEHPASLGVRREFITALNINELYRKHDLPDDLDFMSIDVDGQDFWIWMNLSYQPKVMIIEYNGAIPLGESKVVPFNVEHVWDCTNWMGASLCALYKLGKSKHYTLIYANGVNAIFVRDYLVSNREDFRLEDIWRSFASHAPDPYNRAWVTI